MYNNYIIRICEFVIVYNCSFFLNCFLKFNCIEVVFFNKGCIGVIIDDYLNFYWIINLKSKIIRKEFVYLVIYCKL